MFRDLLFVLDKKKKEMIYNTCIKQGSSVEKYQNVECVDLSLLTVVTVQEARLQAETVYALHAVTQFMHW